MLNDEIVSLAAQKSTAASPVIVVITTRATARFRHNYDEMHPNDAGEAFMAQRWFGCAAATDR